MIIHKTNASDECY